MQVFTSMTVLGLCFGAFVITHIRYYKQRKAESMISLAEVIGLNSIHAIDLHDTAEAADILSDLKRGAPDILNAFIFDKNKEVLASYTKPGVNTFHFSLNDLNEEKFRFTPNELLINKNIVINKETIGSVYLRVRVTELDEIKNTQYHIAIVLLIVGVGLAFIIALIMEGYFSKRLLYLVNIMKQVSTTGDYKSHLITAGKDEISALSTVFNQLMDQVMESQKKKDEFIGIASHELKTPLTSIKAYLQVLNNIEDKQPHKKYVQRALENVNKLQQLIYDLLDVSKIQSGQLELNKTEFDIDSLVNDTIGSFQIVSGEHNIIRNNSPLNQRIYADKQRI
ncbi:MAG: hypothetical protein M3Z92_09565, partial [Bacteroidota bacterium]|nr:hypothetical protein [Bacteroidota bacterium]